MSSYNGRRAPNVSQYLANLNQIPTGNEVQPDNIDLQNELDFLTNAEFFDFDQFHPHAHGPQPAPPTYADEAAKNAHQLQYGEFQNFPNSGITSPNGIPSPPTLQGSYPTQGQHYAQSPVTGDKRKASVAMPTAADLEEASRMAAEEDKRRRNTAASARFRVKKKQREQALEKDNKDMKERVQQLEGKVQQLEMENKWLKGLITDKTDTKGGVDGALDAKKEKESEERSTEKRSDGVGTTEGSKGDEGEA